MQPETNQFTLNRDALDLPRKVGDGLVLQWATPQHVEQLAEFNSRIHSEEGQAIDEGVGFWTRDLMRGDHPTTTAGDFTIVTYKTGKIVSSLNLISQTWTYDGIKFEVGRPEAVGTDEAFRRQGLVRMQFDLIHRRSALRGEILQAITGIPWYYRQFDYEMAVNLNGSRRLLWSNSSKLEKDQTEIFKLRPATVNDIEVLTRLYAIHCQASLIARVRSRLEWNYELTATHERSIGHNRFIMIENPAGAVVGYLELLFHSNTLSVREAALLPGQNLRMVCESLTRALKEFADAQPKTESKEPAPAGCIFALGAEHPVYTALGGQLEKPVQPYAWYIRIADLPGFIRHISPALEKRLVGSVMENYTGSLRLNFYRSQHTLVFEEGKFKEVGTFKPGFLADGDALFPGQTFLQLLLGYHSLEELRAAHPDLYSRNERAAVLLNILFPKRPSHVSPLS